MKKLTFAAASFALFALSACAEPAQIAAPADVEPLFSRQAGRGGVIFAHRAPHTPPFKGDAVSLTARAGEPGSVTLEFADGTPFARFSVTEESLVGATLDGEPIGPDEVVEITIRRVDASRYLLDMQPSGLVFNPASPAAVEFYYDNAILPHGTTGVYKQEGFGEAWSGVDSQDDRGLHIMRGRVDDFTIYAMAAPH